MGRKRANQKQRTTTRKSRESENHSPQFFVAVHHRQEREKMPAGGESTMSEHQRSSSSSILLLHCAVYHCGFRAGESAIHSPLTSHVVHTKELFFHPCVRCRFTLAGQEENVSKIPGGDRQKAKRARPQEWGNNSFSQARFFFRSSERERKKIPKREKIVAEFKTVFGKRTQKQQE